MDLLVSEGYSAAKARPSREAMVPLRSGLLLRAMCVSIVLQHPGSEWMFMASNALMVMPTTGLWAGNQAMLVSEGHTIGTMLNQVACAVTCSHGDI